ncbi:MAG: hypothetical protein ACR2HX_11980 [Pyrinomonadaceae bacterium]
MRSLIRYSLVGVGTLALLTLGFVSFRARLEQKAQAQRPTQVAGCNATIAPSRTNPCLVISSFRQNGPAGSTDEFVEIFNASQVNVTISNLSDDPGVGLGANGIGVFASAGNGRHPTFGQAANVASLACQIPGTTVIPGRRWYLCGGQTYSLSNLGTNSGALHSVPDTTIGTGTASTGTQDLPDDAGLALLNIGSNIVTQCVIGSGGCPSGFNYSDPGGGGSGSAVVLDKVGFNPYGPGSPTNTGPGVYPGNIYPSLAAQYCEGTLVPSPVPGGIAKNLGCLQPVGDASTITLGPGAPCPSAAPNPGFGVIATNPNYTTAGPTGQYDTFFPVTDAGFITRADGSPSATRKCYGESGQYKIERRRSGQTFANDSGEIHKDSFNSVALNVSPPQNTFGACAQSPAPGICGNSDDFILDAPNPSTNNVGLTLSGTSLVTSVLGSAWPHACDDAAGPCTSANPNGAPAIIGNTQFTQSRFDTCAGAVIPCTDNQLGPRNAERRYAQDPNILGTNNDPFGTFILRFRYVNNLGSATAGQRWRLDDLSTLCGGQTVTTTNIILGSGQTSAGVATQEARNLRGPDFSTIPAQTPTPSCQGEGSDVGFFTSILKGVNHYGEVVVDSSGTARVVAGTVLEDVFLAPAARPATGALQPFGGGSNSTFVVNTTATNNTTLNVAAPGPAPITLIGDGVSGGTGRFHFPIASAGTFRVAFKFGVVRSGRFKVLLGREIATSATPLP